jgi:hypothetical protein
MKHFYINYEVSTNALDKDYIFIHIILNTGHINMQFYSFLLDVNEKIHF